MVSTQDISNLIQAVKANPTDKTARLALADAFEEQGNDSAAREQRTLAKLTVDDRGEALRNFLDVDEDEVNVSCYGKNGFEANGGEYLVLTDEEANERAAEQILDSVWAFNTDFILEHITTGDGSPAAPEKAINAIRNEDFNGLLRAALDDEDEFVRDAIRDDGRGLFLAGYDHNENEVQYNGAWLYIYRVN